MIKASILILLMFLVLGCYSYTTFQKPEVLEEGEKLFGVGITPPQLNKELEEKLIPEFYFRRSLLNSIDGGIRFKGVPLAGGIITMDLKYGIFNKPINLSGDIGISYSSFHGEELSDFKIIGIHPMILFGNKRLYTALKYNYFLLDGGNEIFDLDIEGKTDLSIPSLVIGSSVGKKRFIQP